MVGPPARAPHHGVPPPSYPSRPRTLPCCLPPVGLSRAAGGTPAPSIANAMACAPRRQRHQLSTKQDLPLTSGNCLPQLLCEWILLSREDDSCFLMNPFTKATMEIPNLSSYSPYYEPVETVNDHVPRYGMPGTWMDFMGTKDVSVVTLVVCSMRLIAAILAVGDCGEYFCTIALCRPGAAAWSVRAQERRRCLSGMIFLNEKLYAIDAFTEDLLVIDIVDGNDNSEPRVSQIERIIKGVPMPGCQFFERMPYLLESDGKLLMIRRKISYTTEVLPTRLSPLYVAGISEFQVLKADFGCSLWAGMKSLGPDLALFLGRGCSRAVCVSPHDLSRDCIFFIDDYIDGWFWKNTTTSCGVYDMKDGKVYSPVRCVSWKSGNVPATWLFSQVETYQSNNLGAST